MRNFAGTLVSRFRSHHGANGLALIWTGAVGCLAFPAFYLVRFSGRLPVRYDDLELRLIAAALCLGMALRNWWPSRISAYYLCFCWLAIWYCFAFLLSFTLFQNDGPMNSVVNVMLGCTLIVLLTDWRNALVMLLSGYALSFLCYWVFNPAPQLPVEFLLWWFPLGGLLVAAVGVSKLIDRRDEFDRMRHLYNGLAGSIAHEMRTPLVQLRHALDVLDDSLPVDAASWSPERAALCAATVAGAHNAVTRGLQSIDVTLRQLQPQAFDTSSFRFLSAQACVSKALEEFAYEDPDHRCKVSLRVQGDFSFRGDETVFLMILFNLLKNAIHYLPLRPQATIGLLVQANPAAHGALAWHRVVMRDTGPGITPDLLPRLFKDFQTSGKVEGTGLGLAFCMRAMRAFGGTIRCHSVLGEFTEFTLEFPVVEQAEIEKWQQGVVDKVQNLLAGKRVLVVDDEAIVRRATHLKLPASCTVDEAEHGAGGLLALGRVDYDLVIMDINMEGMDGFETTRRIRRGAVPGRESVPILGHSSEAARAVSARGRQAGFNALLSKPCSRFELAEAIAPLLEGVPQRSLEGAAEPILDRTILLAEDSAMNRAIVKLLLQGMGLRVIEADHGDVVVQLLQAGARPDVILMDMNMPGMDGLETTRALRSMAKDIAEIPVIALTADSSQDTMDAALEAGMSGFLVKPLDPQLLRQQLHRVLARPSQVSPDLLAMANSPS
jgi:two-component system CAI-1 autoinducer sensor kinase/phosphatase CqsS